MSDPRSLCPINLTLEIVGDRWSLLIIRDLMFTGRRHFRELLQSDEGISSNVLAERLARLVAAGVLTKREDPTHAQKVVYSLTETGVDLFPVIAQLGIWGHRNQPASPELSVHAAEFEVHGQPAMDRMYRKIRAEHLARD